MKKSNDNKKIPTLLFSILIIGGAAAILGIYRTAKNSKRATGCVMEDLDGSIFVYGANA